MTAFFCLALVILIAGYLTAQANGKKKKQERPAQPVARDVLDELEGKR